MGFPDQAKESANQALSLSKSAKDKDGENYASYFVYAMEPRYEAPQYYDAGPAQAAAADSGAGAVAEYSGPTADQLRPKIQELALSLLGVDEIHADSPLMDAGLDSLSMVQFRNQLQQSFSGVSMPASLIFDNPSVSAVSDYIATELKDAA